MLAMIAESMMVRRIAEWSEHSKDIGLISDRAICKNYGH